MQESATSTSTRSSTAGVSASALALLTPTETNALWSFLTQADKADVLAPEWAIFANRPELAARNRETKEELVRATRSLISIDDNDALRPSSSSSSGAGPSRPGHRPHAATFSAPDPTQRPIVSNYPSAPVGSVPMAIASSSSGGSGSAGSSSLHHAAPLRRASASSSTAPAPPVNNARSNASHTSSTPRKRLSQDQPEKTPGGAHKRQRTSSNLPLVIPSAPSSSSNHHIHPFPSPSSGSEYAYPTSAGATSSYPESSRQPQAPQSVTVPPAQPAAPSAPAPTGGHGHRNSVSSSAAERAAKPALLTTSQKKANHIQSEQKRRANIRRGYEALCEIVPALREAIRAEEEAERNALAEVEANGGSSDAVEGLGGGGSGEEGGLNMNAIAMARKKARGKAVAAAFGIEDGEKVDGRAGPRSEAVVLQKSIEHIGALEVQRTSLMDRIHSLRALLPPNHPALIPLPVPPHIIASRRAPFIPPVAHAQHTPLAELTPEERETMENWNEGSAAPVWDERAYEVPAWARVWDGGTGLPIPGMGLMKPGMKGFGAGAGGGRGKGEDDEDEGSDDDM